MLVAEIKDDQAQGGPVNAQDAGAASGKLKHQRESLKSARGGARQQPEAELTMWLCDRCRRPNIIDSPQCKTVGCEGNIEACEDFEALQIQQVTQTILDQRLKDWQASYSLQAAAERKQAEANKLGEDDWKCEFCQTMNKLKVGVMDSCRCTKCLRKNENIEEMLYIMGNQQYQQAEQKGYEDLKHDPTKPSPVPQARVQEPPAAGYYKP